MDKPFNSHEGSWDGQDSMEGSQTKVVFQTISRNVELGMAGIKNEYSQLKVPESDQEFVVDLAATDGENTYTTVVKSTMLPYRLAMKGEDRDEEWEQICRSLLFGTQEKYRPVVCTYDIKSQDHGGSVLTLNVHRGHAPRPGAEASIPILGTFDLRSGSKKGAISQYEMILLSTSKLGPILKDNHGLRAQNKALEEQLANFLKQKTESENELFEKFALLLNRKKLKLRALRDGFDGSDSEDDEIGYNPQARQASLSDPPAQQPTDSTRKRPLSDESDIDQYDDCYSQATPPRVSASPPDSPARSLPDDHKPVKIESITDSGPGITDAPDYNMGVGSDDETEDEI